MKAYINTKYKRLDGSFDCFATVEVDVKESPLWWQEKGLQFTARGYGSRIPTRYMVQYMGKWRRVYCIIYSNSGTLFIGKKYDQRLTVSIYGE